MPAAVAARPFARPFELGAMTIIVVLDQLTKLIVRKSLMLGESHTLIPGFLDLTHVQNTGAAFGILGDLPAMVRLPLFLGVAVFAIVALASYLREIRSDETTVAAALGGILGGAFGNLIDRVRYGEVVDFLHLHYRGWDWPMFNVADSAITVGVVLVLIRSLRTADGQRANAAPATERR